MRQFRYAGSGTGRRLLASRSLNVKPRMAIIVQSTKRPIAVKLALLLLVLDAVAGDLGGFFYGPWNRAVYYYMFGVGLVLDFVPLWLAFRRQNWARWFVALYTIFSVCDVPFFWHRHPQTYSVCQALWIISSDIVDLIALVLLFRPSSNRWFGRRANTV